MPELILLRDVDIHAPAPRGRGDILLAGGRIASVGPRVEAPVGVPCEIVSCAGARAIPGLVDVHAHLAGGGGEGGAHTRVPPPALTAFTRAGVTSAVGLLGTDATTRSLGELLAAARALAHYGLSTWCYTGSYQVPPPTITGSVRGDLVHVDRMIAVGEIAISDHRSSQPTFAELARIAADAHVAGLMTGKAGLLHLHVGDGPQGLAPVRRLLEETELPTRTLHPTHCNRNPDLWAEALALGGTHGLYVDVTAFPAGDSAGGSAEPLGAGHSASACIAAWLADRAPGRITCSSDGGGCLPSFDDEGRLVAMDVGRPDGLLRTVAELVHAGVPWELALAPVTTSPAQLYRLHGKGRLEIGADADVVVLDGTIPRHVLAGARWLLRDGQPVVRGVFEVEGRAAAR